MSSKFKLAGIEMKYFIPIFLVIIICTALGKLPAGMLGALPLMIVIGVIFDFIGNKTTIIKDYLGGGPIVIFFLSAFLVYYNLIPEKALNIMVNFTSKESFLDFYIAALIVGSILGMNRNLLIKAALGYLPVILGGVVVSLLLTGVVGLITGYGFLKAIFFIAISIMGGGMGAGAIPLAQIFSESFKQTPTELLAIMVPAVALGNALAIVCGGLLDKLGKKYPSFSGNGKLLKSQEEIVEKNEENKKIEYEELGIGLVIATTFFAFGSLLSKFIPVHSYALMIISVAICKLLGVIEPYYESCCSKWFNFVVKNFTIPLLVGVGVAYTSIEQVISSFSLIYFILVVTTVVGAIIGTAIVGHFVGFYIIEGSITAGLCMANMGGTGDVAVLSVANRMSLMPFAQISSRIGGAFMLLLTSLIINFIR